MSNIDWQARFQAVTMAIARLKHLTKHQMSASLWTPEYKELAEEIDEIYHRYCMPTMN